MDINVVLKQGQLKPLEEQLNQLPKIKDFLYKKLFIIINITKTDILK